ncbi:M23 family metallopeptidase [Crocosphaera sp. Alani8]|uniref:M23 family metallopeptidase n=1 Tax=Crocosphaera sp. Alani8 TaxID=3038952 RepID=UPI00313CE275
MLRRIFVFFLLIIIALVWLTGIQPHQVAAQEDVFYTVEQSSTIPTMTYEGVTYPDWENLSFSSIPPSMGAGHFNLSEMAGQLGLEPNDLIRQFGYDPSRSWDVGTPIENILKLGDLRTNSNLENWTINNIASYTGMDSSLLRLADFGLLGRESIEDLVDAVPLLGSYRLRDVIPLFDLVKTRVTPEKAVRLGRRSLASLSDRLNIGTIKLEELDLTQYDLTSIPNLENAKFGSFINWEDSFLSEIPGLANVPIASFILDLAQGGFLAKLDIVFGEKEANRTNTISGSYQEGFKVPCEQENCAHIELTDAIPSPTRPLHGKQWISGKSQRVKGGSGLLGSMFGGSEPTGRHPFGEMFKVVLTDTNESTGTASFSIYFRICGQIFWSGKTCTPYIIGPFPWFSHKEKDFVFVGVDGVDAEVPDYLPPVPSVGSIPPEIADNLPPGFQGEGYSPDVSELNFGSTDDCETYKGVHMGALKEAIAKIESEGSGGYYAVGDWASCGINCTIPGGHGLGKYQFMTYREEVVALYGSEGRSVLDRSYAQNISKAELRESIKKYFPPEAQDKLFFEDFKKMMAKAFDQGHRGKDIVYMLGGWHYAGRGSFNQGYAVRARKLYQQFLKESKKKCSRKGKCTGKFIHPSPGYIRTSRFGECRPLGSCSRSHAGTDVGTPIGTKIRASDGGTVTYTSTYRGYGITVDIKHCEYTTRYAHLSKPLVKNGQKVNQGDVIALSGQTGIGSGPHLHFEIRLGGPWGKALDPEKFINF